MELPGSLEAIAQIGVTFAGFSGLIVAFRKDAGPLTRIHKYRLQVLLSLSLGATFLSLLPELLLSFGVATEAMWRLSSVALSLYSVVFMIWWMTASLKVMSTDPGIFNWFAITRMTAGHIVIVLAQFSFLFSIVSIKGPAAYLVGLIWYLLHAAQQFTRMLYVRPKSDLAR
jgi:hypothetical protein